MNRFKTTSFVIAGALVSMPMLPGCALSEQNNSPPSPDPVYAAPPQTISNVAGFAWDPEAFYFRFFACNPPNQPPACNAPPVLAPGFTTYDHAAVAGSMVQLFDPLTQQPAFMATAPSTPDGAWQVIGAEPRDHVPYFALATPTDPTQALVPSDSSLPPVPTPTAYFPTFNLRPIFTHFTSCIGEPAALISDSGVLQAVTNYLNYTRGTSLAPGDLLKQYGGVAVIWASMPQGVPTDIPAFGVTIGADQGEIFNLAWQPPRSGPPFQSDRGYFVASQGGPSPMGLTVVLLPAPMGPPTPVQFSVTDEQSGNGRPWNFAPLPPMIVPPGVVSFLQVPGIQDGAPPPPEWTCLE